MNSSAYWSLVDLIYLILLKTFRLLRYGVTLSTKPTSTKMNPWEIFFYKALFLGKPHDVIAYNWSLQSSAGFYILAPPTHQQAARECQGWSHEEVWSQVTSAGPGTGPITLHPPVAPNSSCLRRSWNKTSLFFVMLNVVNQGFLIFYWS